MNAIGFLSALAIHLVVVINFKLLDNFELIMGFMICCALLAGLLYFVLPNQIHKKIAKGFSYGSLTSIVLVFLLILFLHFNFPR